MRKTPSIERGVLLATAAALALLLACPVAQAQWKWRDERGQIHVSDLPPPHGIPDADVLQRPAPVVYKAPARAPAASAASAAAASGTAKPGTDPQLEAAKRQADRAKAAQDKAANDKLAAQRKDNCARARDQLAALESGQRIARIKPDGEREIMDDAQRAQESQRARQVIAGNCH